MITDIKKGSETVLIVDDEPHVLQVSKKILEALGYRVYEAAGGEKGIALYQDKKDEIELVILDMIMPGLSGSDTFNRIKEINPEARIVLSSGYSLDGQAQEIMDKGCHGFIQKPFNVKTISVKLREVLDGSQG
jgi:CheY-like chemotaxis protein